jgi:hypothetical protein
MPWSESVTSSSALATVVYEAEVVMIESQALFAFVALTLAVFVTAITFLLIQRARKKRSKLT